MPVPASQPSDRLDHLIEVTRPWIWVALAGLILILLTVAGWGVVGTVADIVEAQGLLMRKEGVKPLKPPLGADEKNGVVRSLPVESGRRVRKGDLLAEVEVEVKGGKEVRGVLCPVDDAVILRRVASVGAVVGKDDALLLYELRNQPLQVLLYPPTSSGYRVEAGMRVHVTPANAKQIESGYLIGRVVSAGKFPVGPADLSARLQNEELVRLLPGGGPSLQLLVELDADPASESGARWSAATGRSVPLYSGIPCQARVIVREHPPLNVVFPGLLPERTKHR